MSNPTNEPQIYSADAELHGDGAEVTITLNASAVQLLLLRRRDAVGKVEDRQNELREDVIDAIEQALIRTIQIRLGPRK